MAAPTFVETTMQILHRGFLCLPCMRGRRAVRRAFKHWANHWYNESDSTEDDERTASAFRIGHRAGTAVLPPCSTPQQLTEHQSKNTRRDSWVYVRQYCAEIDEAARSRMELIVRSLAEQNGVTEQLKAENQMEWVRQMNACKAQAEEIVKAELIYD